MIPIPLQVTCYDRGPGGTFTRQNPVSLAGRLTSYEDAIDARGGFKSLRVSFACSAAELKEWLDAGLMREVRAFTPRGRLRWEGVLVELKATIGPIVITRSLDDMANSFVVSYGSDSGNRGATSVYSNLTSIAEYGTKQLAHDLSTTTAAGAANWAQTELKKAAWPQRSRETNLNTGTGGGITIELRAIGRYDLLDWLLTSNTSTATAATTAQAISLLTSYNSTNNWFSTSAANVVASGHSDTQYIDPNTSYLEKLETLLSQGNSSQNAQAWGIYEDGTLSVNVWAGATPSVVSYYRDARDRTVRDSAGNIVEPWDVLPDAMVEDVALISMAEDASAIATLLGQGKPLVEANAVSKQEYANAVAALKQAEAEVAAARAGVDTAQINLGQATVTAPITLVQATGLPGHGFLLLLPICWLGRHIFYSVIILLKLNIISGTPVP